MKDKKDGKNRSSYATGCGISMTNSPLASSTTEKDDLTLRSYQHHQHGYYQPTPPPPAPSSMPVAFHPHVEYTPSSTPIDPYDMSANYPMKQSNYYPNGNPPKMAYHSAPYDNYYFNPDNSAMHHQQSGPLLPSYN